MEILSMVVYKYDPERPVELSSHYNLQKFNMFQRGTVKELIKSHSRIICGRTDKGGRQSIAFEQNIGQCYVFVNPNGLAVTVVTSSEYPMRVAFSLISEVMRVFQEKHCGSWESQTVDLQMDFPEGDDFLKRFQNPAEADKLTKVQQDLEEVQGLVVKSLDEILRRGENLDSLLEKSADLSTTSYDFYRQAKKNNQCCKMY
eukprot:Platyproteum_vivax@DN16355_c0_g1_i1.p1